MNNPFKKNDYIEATDSVEMTETKEEETMEKVSFFSRHKKGILIGAGAAALAIVGGLVAASKRSDDDFDDYEDDLDLDNTPSDDVPAEDAE